MSIQPFTIAVPQTTLDDLHERLAHTRWPEVTDEASWGYGISMQYMQELMNHWQHTYNWREHEATLNNFANFSYSNYNFFLRQYSITNSYSINHSVKYVFIFF